MVCPKCGTGIEQGATFCTNCGERLEQTVNLQNKRIRKQYKTAIYVILDIAVDAFIWGINDLYAGFYKIGLYRLISSVLGFVLGLSTSNLAFLFFPGLSALIGLLELFGVVGKQYTLEDGRRIYLHSIDVL